MKSTLALLMLVASVVYGAEEQYSGGNCVPNRSKSDQWRVQGFRCTGIDPQSDLYKAGIRSNDIILTVDDQKITKPEQMMDLSYALERSTYSKLLILRDGREVILRRQTAE